MNRKLANREGCLVGTILSMPLPTVMEMVADAGFDWVLIDMEHSALSLADLQLLLAAAGEDIITIVRVPGNDEIVIKRVLDLGCDGIMVPMVNSRNEAERAVAASLYPPIGRRSTGIGRAHRYGARFKEYVTSANRELIIMVQAEHHLAADAAEEIAATPGLTAVFIGPYDLSASMGLAGMVADERVTRKIGKVIDACNREEMPWGIFAMKPESLRGYPERGCRFALCGVDIVMLSSAAREVASATASLLRR